MSEPPPPDVPPPGADDDGDTAVSRTERVSRQVRAGQERVRAGQERAKDELERLRRRRSDVPAIDVGFAMFERDRDIYAGTLAGGLAFRLFLFLLPLTLVGVALLGFTVSSDPNSGEEAFERLGLGQVLADALREAGAQGQVNRWWALIIGVFGTCWAALWAVRTLMLVQYLAWRMPPQPVARLAHAAAGFVGATLLLFCTPILARLVRGVAGVVGTLAEVLGVLAVYIAVWIVVAWWLPHRPVRVQYLVPGALLMAVGTETLHLVTRYILEPQVERSTSVYGAVGVAAVILTWLYIIARLLVASAVLNAILEERREERRVRRGAAPAPGLPDAGGVG